MFSGEFKHNKVLQAALGVLAFCYFIVFYSWIRDSVITTTAALSLHYACPRYFQSCDWLYILNALPFGYSQTILYMGIFVVLIWIVYLLTEREWSSAQQLLLVPFFWHAVNVLILTDDYTGNYEYYLLVFGLVLLFLPHKEFFLKLSIVFFYVLSTVAKIHPAWIEGGYFNNLRTGLPLFPDWSIPLFTNLIILMEMVGAWFLMSSNRLWQRAVFIFFFVFHIYSGILVEYRYPATVLPMLFVAFGPWYRHIKIPMDYKSLGGWFLIAVLILFQFIPRMITGDEKLTLEGNKYGLYMFESNHQCISTAIIHKFNGTNFTENYIGSSARNRCDPYNKWFRFKQICNKSSGVKNIEWTLDHSINGGPFLRIVDEVNVCELEYQPFRHNNWIKTEGDNPEVIGWPVKNFFH